MAKNVIITKTARKKLVQARAGAITLPKIVGMVFGSGGVDSSGNVIAPSENQTKLNKELFRKPIDGYSFTNDTTCFTETIQWNTTNNNNGNSESPYPYMVSNLKKWLDETLYGYLPDKVKNQIAHKRMLLEQRYSSAGALTDSTSWGWQDLGALWVPLEYEVFGAIVWGTPGWSEGQAVQYPIFANTYLSRIKGAGNGGSRCDWWLASVGSGTSTAACGVNHYGGASRWTASSSLRVPVCFRITA